MRTPFAARGVEIGRDIARRVDDDRLAARLASDQVARLRQAVVVAAADQHRQRFKAVSRTCGEPDTGAQQPLADDGPGGRRHTPA